MRIVLLQALCVLLTVFVFSGGAALAQDEPVASGEEVLEAAVLYDKALLNMKNRAWRSADELLRRYMALYPKGEDIAVVVGMQEVTEFLASLPVPSDRSGRTEFTVFSALYGLWIGTALGLMGDFEGGTVLLSLMGAGGGIGLALGLTSGGRGITRAPSSRWCWGRGP